MPVAARTIEIARGSSRRVENAIHRHRAGSLIELSAAGLSTLDNNHSHVIEARDWRHRFNLKVIE